MITLYVDYSTPWTGAVFNLAGHSILAILKTQSKSKTRTMIHELQGRVTVLTALLQNETRKEATLNFSNNFKYIHLYSYTTCNDSIYRYIERNAHNHHLDVTSGRYVVRQELSVVSHLHR